MADLVITIDDVRKAGYCTAGARRWFERHGLDFRDFLQNGMSAAKARAVGDLMAETIVAKAEARAHG